MQGFEASLPPPKHKRSTDEVFSEPQRLHKVLASCGFGSRRAMEELILAGRITVNRMPADIGQKVGPGDEVRINGEPVKIRFAEPKARVLVYHKPAGELVSRDDPEERPTVFGMLPAISDGRWIAVGRLDYNTEGLLLFTNSGELANRLMHPRYEVEREYAVRVMGRLTDEQVETLKRGVELDDGPARCEKVEDAGGDEDASNHWYKIVVKEGRNREVRRLFEALGLTVSRLLRVRYGRVAMPPQLKRGEVMELEPQEVGALLKSAGLKGQAGGPQQPAGQRQGGKPHHGKPRHQAGGPRARRRKERGRRRPAGRRTQAPPRGASAAARAGSRDSAPRRASSRRSARSTATSRRAPAYRPGEGPMTSHRPRGSGARRGSARAAGFGAARGERPPEREVNGNVARPGSAYRPGEGPMTSHRPRGAALRRGSGRRAGQKKRRRRGRGGAAARAPASPSSRSGWGARRRRGGLGNLCVTPARRSRTTRRTRAPPSLPAWVVGPPRGGSSAAPHPARRASRS